MAVKYFIYQGTLLGKKKIIARVTEVTTYLTDEFVARMVQGKTGLGSADVEAFLTLFKETVVSICKEGGRVNLEGFMSIQPSVGGTFDSETSSFDKSKNQVYMISKISSALNARFQLEADVEKVSSGERKPVILEVVDLETDSVNGSITQGSITTVKGEGLKFDPASEVEYLELVNANNAAESVKIVKFQKVTDKEVVFLCPLITYANVKVEIGTLMGTQSLRIGDSDTLTVK